MYQYQCNNIIAIMAASKQCMSMSQWRMANEMKIMARRNAMAQCGIGYVAAQCCVMANDKWKVIMANGVSNIRHQMKMTINSNDNVIMAMSNMK